jgi:hypothetical protein
MIALCFQISGSIAWVIVVALHFLDDLVLLLLGRIGADMRL